AGLRAALGSYAEALDTAERSARSLAATRPFQISLARQDRAALQRVLTESAELRVEPPGGFRVGAAPAFAAQRSVAVVGPVGLVGRVIASVPLDNSLASTLAARAGLEPDDHVLVLEDGKVVAGPPDIAGKLARWTGRSQTVELGGERFRGVASTPLSEMKGTTLAVVTPQSTIDAANRAFQRRYLYGLLVSIALLGVVAMLQGRAILRAIGRLVGAANAIARGSLDERVPVRGGDELALLGHAFNEVADQLQARLDEVESERERHRDAFSPLGAPPPAPPDPDQPLRVIVRSSAEATP